MYCWAYKFIPDLENNGWQNNLTSWPIFKMFWSFYALHQKTKLSWNCQPCFIWALSGLLLRVKLNRSWELEWIINSNGTSSQLTELRTKTRHWQTAWFCPTVEKSAYQYLQTFRNIILGKVTLSANKSISQTTILDLGNDTDNITW